MLECEDLHQTSPPKSTAKDEQFRLMIGPPPVGEGGMIPSNGDQYKMCIYEMTLGQDAKTETNRCRSRAVLIGQYRTNSEDRIGSV